MANLNKVMLIGNLTRDPVLKTTTSGVSVCDFGIAINRRYKTAQGEERQDICFVDADVFGKTAEACGRYLSKGSPLYVEGHLKYDSWVDKTTNVKRNRLKLSVESVQFLYRSPNGTTAGNTNSEFPSNTPMNSFAPQGNAINNAISNQTTNSMTPQAQSASVGASPLSQPEYENTPDNSSIPF